MDNLFVRPDGSTMRFHLGHLNAEQERKYTYLIEDWGGMVELTPNEKVLTFTVPEQSSNYEFVFDVKFIDDCVEQREILNINSYYLGDKRHNKGCLMTKGTLRSSQCFCSNMKYEYICKVGNNIVSVKYAALKSTESRDKQNNNKKCAPLLKNHASEELNIEKTNKLKQTTLKTVGLDRNNIQDKLGATSIIEETDTDTDQNEIAPSPVLNKSASAKSAKRKVVHREIPELCEPSTSKAQLSQESVLILSSDEDVAEKGPQENSEKCVENSKELDKRKKCNTGRKKSTDTEETNQDDFVDSIDEEKDSVSKEIEEFIKDTHMGKKLDKDGYPESYAKSYRQKFEDWESQAMIRYLVISDKVHEATGIGVWQGVQKLHLLPRQKGAKKMLNYFKTRILPNIKSYNLPPKDLAKFQALGIPNTILEDF